MTALLACGIDGASMLLGACLLVIFAGVGMLLP